MLEKNAATRIRCIRTNLIARRVLVVELVADLDRFLQEAFVAKMALHLRNDADHHHRHRAQEQISRKQQAPDDEPTQEQLTNPCFENAMSTSIVAQIGCKI